MLVPLGAGELTSLLGKAGSGGVEGESDGRTATFALALAGTESELKKQ